jgi:exosortase A
MNMMSKVSPPGTVGAPVPTPEARPEGWPAALAALVVALALLLVLFQDEAAAAVRTWNTSTAFNHCWLVPPIAAWLAWQRRARLRVLAPQPSAWLALLAVPAVAAWLAAERLGIMEGRQLAAFGLLLVAVLACLGWRVCFAMAVPLAYLVFMVPFGGFAVAPLQRITAYLVEFGLMFTDIPHYVDALIIEIPAGTFFVAEACAGLRFSIAALAFGALYAAVMFRSPGRRVAVLVLAVVVPIVANGIRALGIVLVAHWLGNAEAAAADHVIYGWVFFSTVILLLILAGLPFREDGADLPVGRLPPPAARRPRGTAALAAATGLVVLLASTGPAAAALLARSGSAPVESVARLAPIEGCVAAPDGAGLVCRGIEVSARLIAFSPRTTWSAVSAMRFRVQQGGSDEDLTYRVAVPGQANWQARHLRGRNEVFAMAAWLGGRQVGDGLATRARQGWNSLAGGQGAPVLAVVVLRPAEGAAAAPLRDRALVHDLLAAQGGSLVAQAAELSAAR